MSTPTQPGTVIVQMGNQPHETLINLDDPARVVTRAPEKPRRKQRRTHMDKQRHQAHADKDGDQDG